MPLSSLLYRLLPFGRRAELQALDYLRTQGFRIAASNFKTKNGEADIIAWEDKTLVFVEVKARKSLADPPENAVGYRKQQQIIHAARAYIARRRLHDVPYRFDILAVTAPESERPEFRLLRDAFRMYN
jgi:putative endonuclease